MGRTPVVRIEFVGPYAWLDLSDATCVYQVPPARSPGVYLWTIPSAKGHLVYYIGETGTSFSSRLQSEYGEHAKGWYHVNNPAELRQRKKVEIWPGIYDPYDRRTKEECRAELGRLTPTIQELTRTYRFLLAPLALGAIVDSLLHTFPPSLQREKAEKRLRRRIERKLFDEFRLIMGEPGTFLERGVNYPRERDDDEVPIQCIVTAPGINVVGLPMRFTA